MDPKILQPDEIHVYKREEDYSWVAASQDVVIGISRNRTIAIGLAKSAAVACGFTKVVVHRQDGTVSSVMKNFKKPPFEEAV